MWGLECVEVMMRSMETVNLHLQVLVVQDVWEESSPLEKAPGRKCPPGSNVFISRMEQRKELTIINVLMVSGACSTNSRQTWGLPDISFHRTHFIRNRNYFLNNLAKKLLDLYLTIS